MPGEHLQGDTDKLHFSVVRHGHQRVVGLGRVTGLSSHRILVIITVAGHQHLVLLLEYMLLRGDRCRYGVACRLTDGEELRIVKELFCDQCHISGTGIMIFFVDSVGVDKMGIRPSQLLHLAVHLVYEPLVILSLGLCHRLSHRVGHFIGGGQKHGVERLLHGDDIPLLQSDGRITVSKAGETLRRDHNILCHIAVLKSQKGCQQLCDTGRIFLLVNILSI